MEKSGRLTHPFTDAELIVIFEAALIGLSNKWKAGELMNLSEGFIDSVYYKLKIFMSEQYV